MRLSTGKTLPKRCCIVRTETSVCDEINSGRITGVMLLSKGVLPSIRRPNIWNQPSHGPWLTRRDLAEGVENTRRTKALPSFMGKSTIAASNGASPTLAVRCLELCYICDSRPSDMFYAYVEMSEQPTPCAKDSKSQAYIDDALCFLISIVHSKCLSDSIDKPITHYPPCCISKIHRRCVQPY